MKPPKNSLRFLRWFCREDYIEEIEGDLTELFEKEVPVHPRLAKWKFRWQVLKYFRPAFMKSFRRSDPSIHFNMIHHILLITFRNFLRHKRIFIINMVGLTAGLTSVLMIYLWVHDEISIDQFHEKKERLYRVKTHSPGPDNTLETHESCSVLLPAVLETEMPEVEYVVPMRSTPAATVAIGTDRINATGAFAGKDFFKVFSFPIIYGDKNLALTEKYNMAISEDLAMRLFGSTNNCIGKSINWDLQHFGGDFVISAVFVKPAKTSEEFDFLVTHEMFLEKNRMDVSWGSNPIMVNLTLRPGTDDKDFSDKLNRLYLIKRRAETDWNGGNIFVQRYTDIYLHGRFVNGQLAGGRIDYVILFSGVAIFILAIACINFMNLSTARAQSRMKEIGIKKGMGALRRSIIVQHLGESICISLLSLILSLVAVISILPQFNLMSGKHLTLFEEWQLPVAALVIALFTGLLAGSYPAFYLSGFKPVDILKGKLTSSKHELFIRRGLVIFQFGISIVLIIGVVVVYRQLEFVQNRNLGYDKENVILIKQQGELNKNLESFLDRANELPGVVIASSIGASITNNTNASWGHSWEGQTEGGDKVEFSGASVNFGLIEALGIEVRSGRSFSKNYANEDSSVVINETAAQRMGLKEPVGKWFNLFGRHLEIIGVVKDYHYQSLYSPMKPQFMLVNPGFTSTIVIKIKKGTEYATIGNIRQLCKEFSPGLPFEFTFLDDEYQALYIQEQRVSKLAQYFASVAIVLSCLGLFGLATFSAERRTKEISIRKVLGCGEWRIMRMLSFEFISMVIIAAAVSLPLAWHFAEKWLNSFAYRSTLPVSLFAATACTTLFIALLTVGMQAFKASRINPAESLKSE